MNRIAKFLVLLALISTSVICSAIVANVAAGSAEPTAASPTDSVISVSGSAVIKVKPDVAYVTLGVDTSGASARQAQEANSLLMNSVLKALAGLGFAKDEVKTDRFSVSPDYSYDSKTGRTKLIGYKAQNTVTVTALDLAKVGAIIDSATQAGATTIQGVSYDLRDSEKAKLEALKLATLNARVRAETMVSALGMKLNGIRSASDSDVMYTPMVRSFDNSPMAMKSMDAGAPTPIQEGELEVNARVSVDFWAK